MFRWTGRWSWCASLSAVGFPKDTKYQISCLFHGIGETHDKKIRKRSELSNGCLANGCRLCGDKRGRSPVPNPSSTRDAGDSDWRLGTRESSATLLSLTACPWPRELSVNYLMGPIYFLSISEKSAHPVPRSPAVPDQHAARQAPHRVPIRLPTPTPLPHSKNKIAWDKNVAGEAGFAETFARGAALMKLDQEEQVEAIVQSITEALRQRLQDEAPEAAVDWV